MLTGARILITGPTGHVAQPIATALAAAGNEVWGVARFSDPPARERLEAAGVRCVAADLASADLTGVPADVDYVATFAVAKTGDADHDLAVNAESVGLLMAHCRGAKAFLHCSSAAVYHPAGHHRLTETDPLGDSHRSLFPTYSVCKIAAEAVARTAARQFGIPTVIARLSVPYGNNGGWPWWHVWMMQKGIPIPVHTDRPSEYNPIHEDDLVALVPRLLAAATVPATVVNLGGEVVSIEDWCAHLGQLTGLEPRFEYTDQALPTIALDTTRMHELVGPTRVDWRDGMRRIVEARFSPSPAST